MATQFEPERLIRWRDAPTAGISQSSLRGKGWTPVSRGLHARTPYPDDPLVHIADTASCVANAVVSHWSAALRYGLWLPEVPSWLPTIVTLQPGATHHARAGIYVARSRAFLDSASIGGIDIVTPEVCLGQLAEDLSTLDLTIAIDSALFHGLCTIDDIERSIRRRQRGLPTLRRALLLAHPRSESAWETILRLIHTACGIEVEPQVEILDALGFVVARGDLRVRGTRRLPEYDGADHRDRVRHQRDLKRDKALSRLDYERYGYIATELINSPVMIVRDAEDALGLPHDPSRINGWHLLVADSSLTWTGKQRLLRRWHRFEAAATGGRHRQLARTSGK